MSFLRGTNGTAATATTSKLLRRANNHISTQNNNNTKSLYLLNTAVVRFQSSFSFSSNTKLLQNQQQTSKKSGSSSDTVTTNTKDTANNAATNISSHNIAPTLTKCVKVNINKKRKDYSWIPRVSNTDILSRNEIFKESLYCGYRPLFLVHEKIEASVKNKLTKNKAKSNHNVSFFKEIEVDLGLNNDSKNNDNIVEFALKLEKQLTPSVPWITSATGLEYYPEWDQFSEQDLKDVVPFLPPPNKSLDNVISTNQVVANNELDGTSDKDALETLKMTTFENEKKKLLSRDKGRKKSILSLMRLKKKLFN
ncbi:uncharacterized protein SCODWIG_00847 [Saccharomycodes ludwigii]|uniref:Uncharacterized protein n=1 Tax=Saccharomycodes ludwigii TaxID=36035 RepID=A0A376B322_9ASCO|nr:uncharacterized protein SCODWIG_00847 [Saccharomycodes ludwigii]